MPKSTRELRKAKVWFSSLVTYLQHKNQVKTNISPDSYACSSALILMSILGPFSPDISAPYASTSAFAYVGSKKKTGSDDLFWLRNK